MDAPPTYEEALAAKSVIRGNPNAPLIIKPDPQAPPLNPYYPHNEPEPPRPTYHAAPSPPVVVHSHSYQQPQVVTVSMMPNTATRTIIVENLPRLRMTDGPARFRKWLEYSYL